MSRGERVSIDTISCFASSDGWLMYLSGGVDWSGPGPRLTTRLRFGPQPSGFLPTSRVSLAGSLSRSSDYFDLALAREPRQIKRATDLSVPGLATPRAGVESIL